MNCPQCQSEQIAGSPLENMFRCGDCGHYFHVQLAVDPVPQKQSVDEWSKEQKINEQLYRVKRIRQQAHVFVFLSVVSVVIAVFALLVYAQASIQSEPSSAPYVGAAFLFVAFFLYLISQVIHIRANTEK